MNQLQSAAASVCYICVAVSVLTVMIPQKRTRKVMSFVIGLFLISSLVTLISSQTWTFESMIPEYEASSATYNERDFQEAVAQRTADNVTEAVDTLLKNEGIKAEDIQIQLKISDKGSISVVRAVIYISEAYRDRSSEIETIVYRNLSKEPEIYVAGEEAQSMAE